MFFPVLVVTMTYLTPQISKRHWTGESKKSFEEFGCKERSWSCLVKPFTTCNYPDPLPKGNFRLSGVLQF